MEDADYALALSIARAFETDAPLIAALLREDEQAERDRNLAQRLQQDPGLRPPIPAHEDGARPGYLDNESFEIFRRFNIPPPTTDATVPTAYSVPTAFEDTRSRLARLNLTSSPAIQSPETKECISCSDKLPVSEIFEAPCSHKLCQLCLVHWIRTYLRDGSSFPLKCCGKIIPIARDNPLISEELFREYEARKVELETKDRTCCSNAACAAFIPLLSIQGDIASCILCGKETCVKCKSGRHPNSCSGLRDAETREVLAMAEAEGWRQCGQCHYMVSLSFGCNHISKL
ncbi:hypothetical protein FAVG1_03083 [Fusarium avenaceum]|nr:hypothetical protein FAVG1_03083 [Fusarium avenaceum]